MSQDLKQSIRHFILDAFLPGENPAELKDDLPLISGGILDSIATLKLIMHLEETYGITLEAHEADREHLDTIDQIVHIVEAKKAAKASQR